MRKKMFDRGWNLMLTIIAVLGIMAFVDKQTVDFTGNWKLNKEKSDFGNVPITNVPSELKISQYEDSVSIERIGNVTWNETLYFNGASFETLINGNKRVSIMRWENDKTIVETGTTKIENQGVMTEYQTVYTWGLSNDHNTLTITTLYKGNANDYSSKAVYDRN